MGFFKKKAVLAVIFVLAVSFVNLLFFPGFEETVVGRGRGILGGGAEEEATLSLSDNEAAVAAETTLFLPLLNPVNKQLILAIPAVGRNWGQKHGRNAVDVAGQCGSYIYASAEGLVIEVAEGWNHGYGSLVAIEHSGGIITRYAHNKKNLAAVGQYVAAGDPVALMGNTGNVYSPSGGSACHVHYEVSGAVNPLVR